MHRRHALHITVVLSKVAHSGPSVCLARESPLPTSRILSRSGSRLKLCSKPAGESVQVELQVFALPCPLGCKTGSSPDVQLTHGPGRTVALPCFVPRSVCDSPRTVQTLLCLCAKYCSVSRHFSADCEDTSVFVHKVIQCFTVCTTSLLC